MNEKNKQIIFEHMRNAEYWRDEADPNDERDLDRYGAYNAMEDLVDELGLWQEYLEYKKSQEKGTK